MQTGLSGCRVKTSLTFISIITLFILSACGESKETYKEGPRDAAPSAKHTTSGGVEGDGSDANVPEASAKKRPSDSELPPPGGPETFVGGGEDVPPPAVNINPPGNLPKPPPPPGELAKPTQPNKLSAQAVAALTDSSGRTYTGSAADGLSKFIKAELVRREDQSKDAKAREKNASSARSFESVTYERSAEGHAQVKFKIRESGELKDISFTGLATSAKAWAPLAAQPASSKYSASVKCIDEKGTCENLLLQLKTRLAAAEEPSVAYVIFRSAVADLFFTLPGNRSANPEYAVFRQFMMDTYEGKESKIAMKIAVLNTYEVVNGRSGFEAYIQTNDNQIIGFTGPLVVEKDKPLSAPLKLKSLPNLKTTLLSTLSSAALVANNEAGMIEVAATMRKTESFKQDTFRIRFTQNLNKIISVSPALLD